MSKPRPDMPPFNEDDLLDDPIELFGRWFELAGRELPLPDAVCLATVDAAGQPDARMVLLKGFDERGFRFFTNEGSAKGAQLAGSPAAALVFYWRELDRQVRVRGRVERVAPSESDEYFASRPRESMVGAWASPQSEALAGPRRARAPGGGGRVPLRGRGRSPAALLGRLPGRSRTRSSSGRARSAGSTTGFATSAPARRRRRRRMALVPARPLSPRPAFDRHPDRV